MCVCVRVHVYGWCEPSLHSLGFIYLMSPYCRWNPTDNVFSSCGLQIRLFMYKIFCGILVCICFYCDFSPLSSLRSIGLVISYHLQHYPIVVYLLLTINICLCGLFILFAARTHQYTACCPKTICLFVHDSFFIGKKEATKNSTVSWHFCGYWYMYAYYRVSQWYTSRSAV